MEGGRGRVQHFPIFPSLPSKAGENPVTASYIPNTHPFDLQAMLRSDLQEAQQKVLN